MGKLAKRWNVACDLAANSICKDMGLTLPSGTCVPGKGQFQNLPWRLSAEEYHRLLSDHEPPEGFGDGPDPGGCGGILPPSPGTTPAEIEQTWKEIAAAAAQQARARGDLPDALGKLVDALLAPVVPWGDVLAEFVARVTSGGDEDWRWPNRRTVWLGEYTPSYSDEHIRGAIHFDTSGSMWGGPELLRAVSEVQGIMRAFVCTLTLIHADYEVHRVEEWSSRDSGGWEPRLVGGGGTSHIPVFEYLESLPEPPEFLISFTDMASIFPDAPPPYPVLFVVPSAPGTTIPPPPFGELMVVPLGEA